MQNEQSIGLQELQIWNPRPYQTLGAKFLIEKRFGALVLWPGFGKTTIVLQAIKSLKSMGYTGNFLIIAPLKVARYVWRQEAMKWSNFAGLDIKFIHGPKKSDQEKADVYVTNFETIPWLLENGGFRLKKMGIRGLVIDELSKFKRHSTSRFKMVKPFLPCFQFRWGLTGSLMTRAYVDLFGIMYVLDQGKALGSFVTHYRKKFFQYDSYTSTYEPYEGAVDKITKLISPSIFTLSERDYIDLPELTELNHKVVLSSKTKAMYKKLHNEFVLELRTDKEIAVVSAVAKMNKCLQLLSGAVYDEDRIVHEVHDEKLEALKLLTDELDDEQAIIAYWFKPEAERLKKLYGNDIMFINGSTSPKQEEEAIAAWNSGTLKYLGLQPASGGHGLNLQGSNARHVVWLTLTNDYDLYDQTIRRILRSGNTNSKVLVHRLIVPGTIDTVLTKMLASKGEAQANLVKGLSELMDFI